MMLVAAVTSWAPGPRRVNLSLWCSVFGYANGLLFYQGLWNESPTRGGGVNVRVGPAAHGECRGCADSGALGCHGRKQGRMKQLSSKIGLTS